MAKCAYCNSSILMGGVQAAGQRFCNKKCLQNAIIYQASQQISPKVLENEVNAIWRGNCPQCSGSGPVEVHKVHQVWSALVLTRWTTNQQVSCRSCAAKSQAGGILFSLVAGWWGFPWGLILTPVQITRNVIGLCQKPDATNPSIELRKLVQVHLGRKLLAAKQQASTTVPPLLPPGSAI